MADSDSEDDDEDDKDSDEDALPGRRRGGAAAGSKAAANAKVFLGDSQIPLSASLASSSSLLNKANHIMNVPRSDPPTPSSGARNGQRRRDANNKPVKLKAPLPDFEIGSGNGVKTSVIVKSEEPVTPSKRNGR